MIILFTTLLTLSLSYEFVISLLHYLLFLSLSPYLSLSLSLLSIFHWASITLRCPWNMIRLSPTLLTLSLFRIHYSSLTFSPLPFSLSLSLSLSFSTIYSTEQALPNVAHETRLALIGRDEALGSSHHPWNVRMADAGKWRIWDRYSKERISNRA